MSTIIKLLREKPPADLEDKKRLKRDVLVEFLATTVFVNFGTLAAVSTGDKLLVNDKGDRVGDVARVLPIAISFGVSIMALAYSFGHMTGGMCGVGLTFTVGSMLDLSLRSLLWCIITHLCSS